jgi:DNA invertase Pin-like site-specific DNA recombinase
VNASSPNRRRRSARAQLEAALDFVRDGDVLVVTKLDRFARSIANLVELVDRLERKGAALRILAMNIDTSTASGRLMLNLLGSIAQFEREIMLERQREGIAKAAAAGKYKGRVPTARAKSEEIIRMDGEGLTKNVIAAKVRVGVASVYRILKARKSATVT